jgi:hypothetical protein
MHASSLSERLKKPNEFFALVVRRSAQLGVVQEWIEDAEVGMSKL